MTIYAQHYSVRRTSQSQPIPGTDQVQNNAGGFVCELDAWRQLDRFLIIGSTGSYYADAKTMTVENAEVVRKLLKVDGLRVVRRIVEISHAGRAPKNDPAIFALAMCCAFGDQPTKDLAFESLDSVCRIGTHLFDFIRSVTQLRGWGRALKRAVAKWYTSKPPDKLAYQLVKYQQRNGWSHRDVLRLCKPNNVNEQTNAALRWAVGKVSPSGGIDVRDFESLSMIAAFEKAKVIDAVSGSEKSQAQEIGTLIVDYDLPRECVPTRFLNSPVVWDALLQKMPLTALVRNLGKMSAVGLLTPLSDALNLVRSKLGDAQYIRQSRLHPMAILLATGVYGQGHGDKGKLSWTVVPQVVDALEGAFYKAFENVEPTGKRHLLSLDVSGSMSSAFIAGTRISAAKASAAMAMVTARTEPNYYIMGFSNRFIDLNISKTDSLESVMRKVSGLTFGSTDCAQPMVWAEQHKVPVDVFVTLTDNETWCGSIHPSQALKSYRRSMGIDAKNAVIGMTATNFTVADPNDQNSLDLVGFDASTPATLSEWCR